MDKRTMHVPRRIAMRQGPAWPHFDDNLEKSFDHIENNVVIATRLGNWTAVKQLGTGLLTVPIEVCGWYVLLKRSKVAV
jgi:hypothetical protein